MNKLPKPHIEVSATAIFKLCVSGFSDVDFQERLLSCASYVENDSTQFVDISSDFVHTIEKNRILPNKVTKDEIKKVYTEKFVPKGSPGRKYYDIIMSAPKGSKCPICGERTVKNLDHYMPKSVYPTLVVTPENLIPTCRDCNFDKHTFTFLKPEDVPLHPYFDDIDDVSWLAVILLPNQTVLYDVNCPDKWSEILKQRVKNHLPLFGLDEYYGSKAGQEIADEVLGWKDMLNESGEAQLLNHLKIRCRSMEHNCLNSWKSALYRGIIAQFDEFLKWLT